MFKYLSMYVSKQQCILNKHIDATVGIPHRHVHIMVMDDFWGTLHILFVV